MLALLPTVASAVIVSSGDVKPPFNLPDTPGPRTFTVPTGGSTGGGIYVGDIASGTLTINNGWTLNSSFATIAFQPTSGSPSGSSVTISDNSVWNAGGTYVGENALGFLNVFTGSTVSATFLVLGGNSLGVGQGNFVSSTLNVGGGLIVGLNGAGNLQLQGSTATAGFVEVGRSGSGVLGVQSGGSLTTVGTGAIVFATEATAIASGAFSGPTVVDNGGFFEVGRHGDANVTVGGGAHVSSDGFAIIATETASTSTLEVSGSGTSFTTASAFEVGRNGDATLTIRAGAQVVSGFAFVGLGANSDSSVTVTGPGSSWTNGGGVFVAPNGIATVLVENGGRMISDFVSLAGESSGEANVTVRGAGTSWTSTGSFDIGFRGSGDFVLENGATISSTFVRLAGEMSGVGTLSMRGGSSWTSNSTFDIGSKGVGILTLESGATISSSFARLAGEATGSGTLTVRGGASWTSSGGFDIGTKGVGNLTLESGASISSGNVVIGRDAGSSGTVTIHGVSTTWNAAGLEVGAVGGGTFTLDSGGTFTNSEFFFIASFGGTGDATITGNGTSFTSARQLVAGGEGTGSLTVSGGALLTTFKAASATSSSGIIGRRAGGGGFLRGVGIVTVTGAGSRYVGDGVFNVGFDGDGTFNIADGGRAESTDGIIARTAGSTGQTRISGSNSAWMMPNSLEIGRGGVGILTMNGGLLTAAQLTLGVEATGTGTLELNGGVIQAGFLAKGAGAAALNFNGGTLRALQDEANFIRAAGFNAANTQILNGGLTIDTNGRTVTLLNSMDGPGALTKTGAGTLNLDGGAQTFAALNANAGTTNVDISLGAGTTVNVAGTVNFGASQTLGSISISGSGVVTIAEQPLFLQAGSTASAVPEPGALSLLALGLAGLLARRRRDRASAS